MIIWIVVIVLIIYYTVKHQPGPPPPQIIDHTYVRPAPKNVTIEDEQKDYDEDHFYSVKDQCWVRQENGVFYRSIPFDEWDFDIDADNSYEVVYPDRLLTREEYEEDEKESEFYYFPR